MVDDKQTQILPAEPAELDRFAAFLGYENPKGFRGDLAHHLHTVAYHYARLFEEAPALSIPTREEIGRASWRERVCQYVENSGGPVPLKKKTCNDTHSTRMMEKTTTT